MKRAALHNLGCKVNEYETEAMQELLEADGYEIVPFTEQAEVYLINTCSVTNIADRKSRQMIHRARKMNPDAIVIAAGCYVQTGIEELKKDASVDIILGNNRKQDLVPMIHEFIAQHGSDAEDVEEALVDIIDINDRSQGFEHLNRSKTGDHTRAFLKVQDGCNQFCTYCIIPYARGRVRSKSVEAVLEEVRGLVENGYKEFVLTGIHLDSYGQGLDQDTKIKQNAEGGKNPELIDLIEAISKVDGVERIRLGSLEPRSITPEFVLRLTKVEQICPHFHLSLQSGCNRTLKRMNRKYTAEDYIEGVKLLREAFVHPAITTDVIVGFPGETEEDFDECFTFLREIQFYEMHVFKYSRRKGTVADKMPEQIPEELKKVRSGKLIELGEQQSQEFRKHWLGQNLEVLMEEPEKIDGRTYWVGFTKEYVKVAVQSEENLKNQLVTVTAQDFLNPDIIYGACIG